MPVIAAECPLPTADCRVSPPASAGWSWRLWGKRRHYMTDDGRTACGRRWADSGALWPGCPRCPSGPLNCRTCARVLAKRQQEEPTE